MKFEVRGTTFISMTDLLTSSADSAIKKPGVFGSILMFGPGLMAMLLSTPPAPFDSTAISRRLSFIKQTLKQ